MLNQILVIGYWILAGIYIFLELTEDKFEKNDITPVGYAQSTKLHH